MAKATLETLPPEILHQIFSLVVAQKDEYTTSLCCTSKRIREFSSAALYGTLTPHEPSGPDELSLQRVIALFHAFTLNPRLGELVQEIDLFHLYTCTKWEPSHLQVFQSIYTMWRSEKMEALPDVSLPPPQMLGQVQYMTWLSELLITKMPNLHTLAIKSQRWHRLGDEKEGRELELCRMETVDVVARAAGGRVLFPHLKTVYVDMYRYLKPLSNAAPNIESLKMSDITWHVERPADFPDIKLPHLKFLEPLEFLTVLERLDVDSDCLWVQRHPDIRRSNYEKVMHLITLLPQRLQDLTFDGFNDDDAFGDDPDPRIFYVRDNEPDDDNESMGSDEEEVYSEEYPPGLAPEQLQTLKQAFGEEGIAFHPSQREPYEIEERRLRRSRWHRDGPEIEWF
ncbi:hypothetical protein K4K51_000996 [Colletotrichum sp. SAR 10_75]|nr:hypothetical protein K4K51_000996 [Colletotrichum sp. SAR 10_75]